MRSYFFALLWVFGLSGCPTEVDGTTPRDDDSHGPVDQDGDGWTDDEDCDDNNPFVNPGAEEECDGVDNDCNEDVDEGFPDSDGDGIDDCHDDDCDVALPPADTVTQLDSCPFMGTVADPWDIQVEWTWEPARGAGRHMPAVGYVDGVGDAFGNVPVIVAVERLDCVHALKGDGSGGLFEHCGFRDWDPPVVADVDGDGIAEVLVASEEETIAAIGAQGQLKWISESYDILSGNLAGLTVADLEGDGDVEVIAGRAVIDGTDGSTERVFDPPVGSTDFIFITYMPVVADLDADGRMEVIQWRDVFDAAGALLWTADVEPVRYIHAAVADVDDDGLGEVFFVTPSQLALHDTDGTLLALTALVEPPELEIGPPCVADFDGDGRVEIAIPAGVWLTVYEIDGGEAWSAPIQDESGIAGCSAFDFDADGAYEVLYADEEVFYIFDGRTGSELYSNTDHTQITCAEFPVVADVDADGSAEVVFISYSSGVGSPGITVLGSVSNSWPAAGPSWAIQDYAVGRVLGDGHVPAGAPPPWTLANVFRGRPPVDPKAELSPIDGELCVASCEHGPIKLSYGVANAGLMPVGYFSVACYALVGEDELLVEVQTIEPMASGEIVGGGIFEVALDQWGDGIRIVVDDDGTGLGTVDECDEGNNVLEILDAVCP